MKGKPNKLVQIIFEICAVAVIILCTILNYSSNWEQLPTCNTTPIMHLETHIWVHNRNCMHLLRCLMETILSLLCNGLYTFNCIDGPPAGITYSPPMSLSKIAGAATEYTSVNSVETRNLFAMCSCTILIHLNIAKWNQERNEIISASLVNIIIMLDTD